MSFKFQPVGKMELTALLLLLTAATMATAAPQKNEEVAEKLQILSRSVQKVRARYRTSEEEGIEITSEINDGDKFLSIVTLDGVQLVSVRSSISGSDILWKVLGHSFFFHGIIGGSEMAEYTVPNTITRRVEKEVKHNHITAKLLHALNGGGGDVNETKRSAFIELLARPELETVMEATEALGAASIYGYENPATLHFYEMVRYLAMLQGHSDSLQQEEGSGSEEKPAAGEERPATVAVPGNRDKRATCTRPGWWWITLYEYGCARCPRGRSCLGLCGNGCNCWRNVCGDCCYNQGCYEHDICCGRHGYFHYKCLNIFDFSCDQYRYQC